MGLCDCCLLAFGKCRYLLLSMAQADMSFACEGNLPMRNRSSGGKGPAWRFDHVSVSTHAMVVARCACLVALARKRCLVPGERGELLSPKS